MRTRGMTLLTILAAACVIALAAGCALNGTSTSTNQVASRDLAMSVADPTTGTTEEMTDLGAFLATEALGELSWSLFHGSDFALFLRDGAIAKQLVWNPTNADYQMTQTRSIAAGPITGTANVTLTVAFFTTSTPGTTGVQIAPLTSGGTAFSDVHSLTYSRQMSGSFANSISGLQRKLTSTSSFTVTGLSLSPPGFTIKGTKTTTFTNTYSDGKIVAGTTSENVNNVVVTAVLQSDGTWLVTATGSILVDYSATITQADGTTTQVNRTATITLNGQRTVRVDMDGTEVDVDMTTGETE
ncbi:MAG TPA: hypothetical protein VMU36_08780 [Spirochaetia bacterium]|nr:hypothetical protein [Spirochaetia bacterium]